MRVGDLPAPRPDELLVVVGPTASGKSALALELAARFRGEIIGADSVQVYRRFDKGSGKPSGADLARVRHHLVDVADAKEPLDAAAFVALADHAIAEVRARGGVPIVCGGSFLWVRVLLFGLAEGMPRADDVRERHTREAEASGREALHARLREVDPAAAARLHPNDLLRVSRALEVFELTGRPMSAAQAAHGFASERYPHRLLALSRSPEELVRRISARTRQFLADGLVDEVRSLVADGYGDTRAMASVGYRQAKQHVDGELSAEALADEIDRATRVFVRRQRTWLRDRPIVSIEP